MGAWWIGFVFIAIICALLTIPLLAYPPSLPGQLASVECGPIARDRLIIELICRLLGIATGEGVRGAQWQQQ